MSTTNIYEDGTYLNKNLTWHEEDSPWKAKQIGKMLRKNHIEPSTVCEIGCGAGETLNCLANDYGAKVLFSGYEISPQAFEICKSKEKENLHFFLKDLLDEGEASFDVVSAIDVFEHLRIALRFFAKFEQRENTRCFIFLLICQSSRFYAVRPSCNAGNQ